MWMILNLLLFSIGVIVSVEVSKLWRVTSTVQQLQINSFSSPSVIAGNNLWIYGTGFSSTISDNTVVFTDDQSLLPVPTTAKVISSTPTELCIRAPYGAGPGRIRVEVNQGGQVQTALSPNPIMIETSFSGYVKDADTGTEIKDVTIRVLYALPSCNPPNLCDQTDDEGAFLILINQILPGHVFWFDADGSTATPPYQGYNPHLMWTLKGRDNPYPDFIYLKKVGGDSFFVPQPYALKASALRDENTQSSRVDLQLPPNATVRFPNGEMSGTLRLDKFEHERTPTSLPLNYFSSTIVQISPFGVTIKPGAKLIFPNRDKIPANQLMRLFRLDQTIGSPNIGRFVEAGLAKVTADGQWVETEANAIKETSYYFVSIAHPLAIIQGRVVESDGQPVRRSIIIVRGQQTYTNENGEFVLNTVPVIRANDRVTVEVSILRPDGRVDSTERAGIEVIPDRKTQLTSDILLQSSGTTLLPHNVPPPTISAPSSFTLRAGKVGNLDIKVGNADRAEKLQVSIKGVTFAKLMPGKNNVYQLRLTPRVNDVGVYTLTLTAANSSGINTVHRLLLKVSKQ
jgi:hypothetical protein